MDTQKIGSLIYSLRKEKGMTQAELAQQLHITDKTVSKWERGKGAPDVSLLSDLSAVFQVDLEKLLAGELEVNQPVIGNMRKLRWYVCPICGNLLFSVEEAAMYCCGKPSTAQQTTPHRAAALPAGLSWARSTTPAGCWNAPPATTRSGCR